MRYKGTYDPTATYDVGDVVIFENGVVYHLQKAAVAGTAPTDTRYWGQLEQNLSDAVKIVGNAGGGGGGGGMVVKLTTEEDEMVLDHTWKEIHDALPVMPVTVFESVDGVYMQHKIAYASSQQTLGGETDYIVEVVFWVIDAYSSMQFKTDSEDGYPSAQE